MYVECDEKNGYIWLINIGVSYKWKVLQTLNEISHTLAFFAEINI